MADVYLPICLNRLYDRQNKLFIIIFYIVLDKAYILTGDIVFRKQYSHINSSEFPVAGTQHSRAKVKSLYKRKKSDFFVFSMFFLVKIGGC